MILKTGISSPIDAVEPGDVDIDMEASHSMNICCRTGRQRASLLYTQTISLILIHLDISSKLSRKIFKNSLLEEHISLTEKLTISEITLRTLIAKKKILTC